MGRFIYDTVANSVDIDDRTLAHLRIVDEAGQRTLTRLAFTVASPALMVTVLSEADVSRLFAGYVGAVVAGVGVVVLVWAVVAELYPARYRAPCMALATASNWLWNFLISFFTTFIVNDIHYWYGLVFGGSCLFLAGFVFFFVIESKDRSLEEIDTMYVLGVNPITSAKWDGSKVPMDEESSRENSAAHQHASAPMDRVPTNTVHE